MARLPLTLAVQEALFIESFKPGGGTRVFKTATEFASTAPKNKRYKRRDFSSLADKFVSDVVDLINLAKTTDEPREVWSVVDERHLVALYSIFHREVYGELPGELAGDWQGACAAAKKILREEFEGEPVRVVEYLRWAFAAERKNFARRSSESTWRLNWRWAFVKRDLLTDYRIAINRALKKHG